MAASAGKPANEAALLVADVYELAGRLRQRGEEIAAGEGQTQARWQLLSVVSEQPLTVPAAARRLGITRQAVQRVANDLAAEGLAELVANPDHRTSQLLALTAAGRETLAGITAAAARFNRELAETLGERDLAAAHRAIRTLVEALRGTGERPRS